MKKYKLTDEVNELGLHRIVALRDIPEHEVRAGNLGGFVESEKNLSQKGSAWVRGDAWVGDNACVYGNAQVFGNACVYGNAQVFGNACVCGNAQVCGNASVYGYACVTDKSWVCENSHICENVYVCENSFIGENAFVSGNTQILGGTWISGDVKICSNEDYITFQIWWDFRRTITWTRSNNMWKSYWFSGTAKELLAKAEKEGERSFREYKRLVEYVEGILKDENSTKKKVLHRDSKGRFCKSK